MVIILFSVTIIDITEEKFLPSLSFSELFMNSYHYNFVLFKVTVIMITNKELV